MKHGKRSLSSQASLSFPVIINRIVLLLFCLLPLLAGLTPAAQAASSSGKNVRVGWFETRFCTTDRFGRRSGYVYEYQQKIAAYTGWIYEYVDGSWPELMQMLKRGDIDMLADVSYAEERTKDMLFSALPMGEEEYYIFATAANTEIRSESLVSLNGKKIGVDSGSIQQRYLADWLKTHDITAEIVPLTDGEEASRNRLFRQEIDAFVTLEAHGGLKDCVPVSKIGSSAIHFAVSKNRPDVLKDLNAAMNRIREEDRFYNQKMHDRYIRSAGSNMFLSLDERQWLNQHSIIRIGYRDNYLPFSATDKATGKVSGALKEYLDFASNCIQNGKLYFEPVAFASTEDALAALRLGEIDCLFPINLSTYDGDKYGIIMTEPPMQAEMYAIVRTASLNGFDFNRAMTAATTYGNFSHHSFIQDHFPNWETAFFLTYEDALQAVGENKADCMMISNYRVNKFKQLLDKYNLATLNTGIPMNQYVAVHRDKEYLYSILNKTIHLLPRTTINASLAAYTYEEKSVTFMDFIQQHLIEFVAIIAVTAVMFLLLVLRNMKAEKKSLERKQLITATEFDSLTGLYNINFFHEYVNQLRQKYPNRKMDAVAIDIEQFLLLNDLNGREFSDSILREVGKEIRNFLKGTDGIATRIEGDRFSIFCEHQEDYQALLDRFQNRMDELVRNVSIRLRMGVMPGQADVDPVQLFDRAWLACNKVRGSSSKHLMIYNEEIHEKEHLNQRLLNDLRRGVEQHEFKVYYQPKYAIQSNPPKLDSAEALVRWEHPELGFIPPNEFIPLFEKNGQISIIDKYVWTETARQIAVWRDKFGITVPVSVNLSRIDLFDPKLESILDKIVEDNGLERRFLKLEITESAYTENEEKVLEVMSRLRSKGYEIEMDDFGAGYSSLNMLSSMPVDVLKMDRAFIMNIDQNDKGHHLVELILDIARNLNVPVIAEGVETESQMAFLKKAGCAIVQGYYFSRPLPPDKFEPFIVKET